MIAEHSQIFLTIITVWIVLPWILLLNFFLLVIKSSIIITLKSIIVTSYAFIFIRASPHTIFATHCIEHFSALYNDYGWWCFFVNDSSITTIEWNKIRIPILEMYFENFCCIHVLGKTIVIKNKYRNFWWAFR